MGLFDWLKPKKPAPPEKQMPDEPPPLPFDHTILPNISDAERTSLWKVADRTRGMPILIRMDDDTRRAIASGSSVAEDALPDIEAFLAPGIQDLMENDECESDWGNPEDTAPGVMEVQTFKFTQSPVALAYVPVEEPWQVFRHIPIGGWNYCPTTETIIAFCKRMNERFGAVPAAVGYDCLDLVPARRPNAEEAFRLAQEMYAFAPDVVCQSDTPSIYALADSLTKSDVWYFWWD